MEAVQVGEAVISDGKLSTYEFNAAVLVGKMHTAAGHNSTNLWSS